MNFDQITNEIYIVAYNEAKLQMHEYFVPEHILLSALLFDAGRTTLEQGGGNVSQMKEDLQEYFDGMMPKSEDLEPVESVGLRFLFEEASNHASNSGKSVLSIGDILLSILKQPESYAAYIMQKNGVERLALLTYIAHEAADNEGDIFKEERKYAKPSRKEMDILRSFAYDMTENAKRGKLDPLIGREDIIRRTAQVLCRRNKNNPIHVGDPGVGKTALVEGLAACIVQGNVPERLLGSRIYSLDMGSILAGTKYRGDFEERLKKVLDIFLKIDGVIIYIDEIHTVVGAGAVSGSSIDAGNILKPYLVSGDLRFIGSTTYEEYKKYFEKDRALTRRFQKIEVNEPTVEETIEILVGLKERYEGFHHVKYTQEALELAAKLSDKYINDRYLPDKAIDLIDEAGAHVNLQSRMCEDTVSEISGLEIKKVISMIAKVPEEGLGDFEASQLRNLDRYIKKEVFGQDAAVEKVVDLIKQARAGLGEVQKPVANLLFIGPTGVGKTEIARQLAKCLSVPLLRYDMSEYQEKHSVARLIGSPPGYIGYEEGGLLTEAIKKTPYCVLLLDEIEKAHSDIYNVLLQIMDYGTLTDNSGKKSDFKNVIIIMTSNVGAREAYKNQIGFGSASRRVGERAVERGLEEVFSPEFRNRLDDIIKFNEVDNLMAELIAKKAIKKLGDMLLSKNIKLSATDKAIGVIVNKSDYSIFGAREIMRVVDTDIKKQIVDEMLFGRLINGGSIVVDGSDLKLKLRIRAKRML